MRYIVAYTLKHNDIPDTFVIKTVPCSKYTFELSSVL